MQILKIIFYKCLIMFNKKKIVNQKSKDRFDAT